MTVGIAHTDTRADRHREKRAIHAAEARPNPGKFGLNRRTRRALAHDFKRTMAPSGAGVMAPRHKTNRPAPKKQRRARAKAY
jgi:hypothetical protein